MLAIIHNLSIKNYLDAKGIKKLKRTPGEKL
jgi:hypothetical protein